MIKTQELAKKHFCKMTSKIDAYLWGHEHRFYSCKPHACGEGFYDERHVLSFLARAARAFVRAENKKP